MIGDNIFSEFGPSPDMRIEMDANFLWPLIEKYEIRILLPSDYWEETFFDLENVEDYLDQWKAGSGEIWATGKTALEAVKRLIIKRAQKWKIQ